MSSISTLGISVSKVELENLNTAWSLIKDQISKQLYLSEGEVQIEDIFKQLQEGKRQLWLIRKGYKITMVCITTIVIYPRIKRLFIDIVVGKGIRESVTALAQIELWAFGLGCTQTETHSLPRVAKLLKAFAGFRAPRIVLLRDIHVNLPETYRSMERER